VFAIRDGWDSPQSLEKKKYRMFLDDYERETPSTRTPLNRHERVLGVDAVRVEHVRVAAHLVRLLCPNFIVCSL
jgi:hypothetical protein